MPFNTVEYGAFLLGVFLLYWLVGPLWLRHLILLGASYAFYGAWNVKYLGLILFSTFLDFGLGLAIAQTNRPCSRRWLLAVSLVGNLGVLAVFKYYGFFVESLSVLLEAANVHVSLPVLNVLLPVGISFYTFQTLSYTIDIYCGRLQPSRNPVSFALYVAFFPQLVAGPIVRASQFLPQLHCRPALDWEGISLGLYRIVTGLGKKVIIADYLGTHLVDRVFATPGELGAVDVLLGIYGYALQIYGDFCGYSDIAIGSAKLLGFDIPENFAAPYKAAGLRDFWRRWHTSLSTWLRDYLYIPLGGSRHGEARTYVSLTITMLLGGLWHGAAWSFVAWGGLHGAGLAIERALLSAPYRKRGRWGRFAGMLFTFHFVCVGWVLFRSEDFTQALQVFGALARWQEVSVVSVPVALVLGFGFAAHLAPASFDAAMQRWFVGAPVAMQALALVVALAALQAMSSVNSPFIYFQF